MGEVTGLGSNAEANEGQNLPEQPKRHSSAVDMGRNGPKRLTVGRQDTLL